MKKAADAKAPMGVSGLAAMYLYGQGVTRDYKEAFTVRGLFYFLSRILILFLFLFLFLFWFFLVLLS